ncbi:MAG: restriction endonuclease subunit S [Caldilineaceae bacterium]
MRIDEVAEVNPKFKSADRLSANSLVSFVPMAAVSEITQCIEAEEEKEFSEVSKGYTAFQNDDVIIAKITPCFENGKIALVDIKYPVGFGSTEFHVIRANQQIAYPRYLYHLLRQEQVRFIGEKRMTGSAGQKRLPATFLGEISIPLPPLAEQKRIAAILDQADALRTKRRAALARLDALVQSVFLEMFGDNQYQLVKLEEVASKTKHALSSGPFGSNLTSSPLCG